MKKSICIFLIFFLLFGFAVPAFAETEYPVPPLDSTLYNNYIIASVPYTNEVTCFLYDSSDWSIGAYQNSSGQDHSVMLIQKYSDAKPIYSSTMPLDETFTSWGTFDEYSGGLIRLGSNTDFKPYALRLIVQSDFDQKFEILYSTVTIYRASWNMDTASPDYTSSVFFSLTPPLVVATGEALTQFQTQTNQTMMIILLCGVGCLALLISLPLLKKVFYRFLNR